VTLSATAFGQNFLIPRIVYQLDTGIFLNRQQENKVLETYYWKEVYKENLDSMFLQAYDCQLALNQVKYNYISLSDTYTKLEEQYYILQEGCTDELRKKDGLLEEKDKFIAKENNRKKRWRTIALAEGGTLVVILTLLVLL
jgi:hypothetical protein